MARKDKDASNKDELYRVWLAKIQMAKDWHEENKGKEMKEYRIAYEGHQWAEEDKAKYNNEIVDNMVYMVVSTLGPAIGMSRPETFVKPLTSKVVVNGQPVDPSIAAARLKVLIDYLWQKLDLEVEFMKAIDDSLIAHDGCFYTGYDMEVFETETDEGFKVDLIESENLVCERIDSDFILVDPMNMDPDLKKARWIAIKWQRQLSEVKEDTRFKNTKDLQPNGNVVFDKVTQRIKFSIGNMEAGQPASKPKERWAEAVEGYDIWDKKNQRLYTLVLTHDKFLREEGEWPLEYNGNGFPIDFLWYNYNPIKGHALADTGLYMSKQKALNFLESLQIDHADVQSNVKLLLDKKKLPPGQDVEKWAEGPAWSWLYTKGDTSTAATLLSTAPGAGELHSVIQTLKRDILAQVGVDQFMVGNAEKLETAAEADKISQGSTAKHSFRARAVERFESKVLTKLAKVAQQVSEETEIPLDPSQFSDLAINNPDLLKTGRSQEVAGGEVQEKLPFMKIDQDLLSGDFLFEIKVGSTGHTNESTERQDAMALGSMAQQNPLINKVELTKILLEKFGFSHLMPRLLRDPQEVAKEQQQQMQQRMQAQMAEPQLKTQTDLQKTQAKNQTAERVAQIKAGTDTQDASVKADSDQKTRDNNLVMKVLELARNKDKNGGGK